MAAHQVQALLMGGQACVFYGGAEFSRDALEKDRSRLETALFEEERLERDRDRIYWAPLKAELEQIRHASRQRGS